MGEIKAQPRVIGEWRVTGDPTTTITHPSGQPFEMTFPKYNFVWYSDRQYDYRGAPIKPENASPLSFSAEEAARDFAGRMTGWKEGPFLHHRTVTYTEWEEVE